MFTWSTKRMSRTRQDSRNIERGDKEKKGKRIKEEEGGGMKGNKEEKKRRVGKTEEERK